MSILVDALVADAERLRSDLAMSAAIDHGGSKGDMREDALRETLSNRFSPRFEFGKGVVVNSLQAQSRPQDIVVTDVDATVPILRGTSGVYAIEAVHAVVEVKSRLAPSEVEDAIDSVASVKRLVPAAHRASVIAGHRARGHAYDDIQQTPFGGVFAYAAHGDFESLANAFVRANDKLPIHERADALGVLDMGVVLWASELPDPPAGLPEVTAVWFESASLHAVPCWLASRHYALAAFYWLLAGAIHLYNPPPFWAFAYMKQIEMEARYWTE